MSWMVPYLQVEANIFSIHFPQLTFPKPVKQVQGQANLCSSFPFSHLTFPQRPKPVKHVWVQANLCSIFPSFHLVIPQPIRHGFRLILAPHCLPNSTHQSNMSKGKAVPLPHSPKPSNHRSRLRLIFAPHSFPNSTHSHQTGASADVSHHLISLQTAHFPKPSDCKHRLRLTCAPPSPPLSIWWILLRH